MNDYILQILAGTKTLDDLPTFQADWKNAGGDAVQAELRPGTTVFMADHIPTAPKGASGPFFVEGCR